MKWQYMKDIFHLYTYFVLIFGPLLMFLINSYRYNVKIEEINKKHDQRISEIIKCQTMECVREQIRRSQ